MNESGGAAENLSANEGSDPAHLNANIAVYLVFIGTFASLVPSLCSRSDEIEDLTVVPKH